MGKRSKFAVLAFTATALAVGLGAAQSTADVATGTWTLFPAEGTLYKTEIQPPVNADGTSSFSKKQKVIPLQFQLHSAGAPVVLQSILTNVSTDDDFGFLSFQFGTALNFEDLAELTADYSFTTGNCHGGSLRWQVRVDADGNGILDAGDRNLFIYYGDHPNFTDCEGLNSQSGDNLLAATDLRFDTSQFVGGTFYDSYADALVMLSGLRVWRASLLLDSGWAGDQAVLLSSATVNGNTWLPQSGTFARTCTFPTSQIKVSKWNGFFYVPVGPPISIQIKKSDPDFRQIDCKYKYNLNTKSLTGVGQYKVEVVIGGTPVSGAAIFKLQ